MSKPILTKAKARWAARRKPEYIQGEPINPNIGVAIQYERELRALIDVMTAGVEKEIERLFKKDHADEFFAQDETISGQARILSNKLIKKFQKLFEEKAQEIAERMVSQANKASSAGVHASMQKLSGGLSLPTSALSADAKQILKASINENVLLIKSIPQQYLNGVAQAINRSIVSGGGLKTLVPYLKKHKGITERRARMISLDQSRKAFSALTAERLQKLNVEEYVWLHTGGSHKPRQLHVSYSGQTFRFDDPPVIDEKTGVRGKPGDAINCFVGSTKVSLANGCSHLWRYFYEGPLVNIIVGSHVLQCTPNHPILTSRGWLPADKIEKGDYLVSSGFDGRHAVDANIDDSVATFDELFASFNPKFVERHAPEIFNFHGDIPQNDVYVASPSYGQLDGVVAGTDKFIHPDEKFFSEYSGYVYTMETVTGWYPVTDLRIISKNCRCRMKPVFRFDKN